LLSGEVKTTAWVDAQNIAREVIREIGYTKAEYKFDSESCAVISSIHEQSPDINRGVVRSTEEEQGAGDQGMMFGYAVDQTDNFMPPALEFSHLILRELSAIRREGKKMRYLRPDAKSQVTIEYNDANKPLRIDTIVVSTQHDDFISASDNTPESQQYADERMLEKIRIDIEKILIPRVKQLLPRRLKKFFREDYRLFVNPTGKFVIGGPHGDTGLTGRKIIVDTYGGKGAHGGGAFSGKDSSKVDRSAAYAARHIAKNLVAAGVAKEVLIQVAYAIGVAEPVGLYVNTYGTSKTRDKSGRKLTDSEISDKVKEIFDMRPAAIVKRLGLKNPIFLPTASYGHVGRDSYTEKVIVTENGKKIEKEVEFFTWEKLDYVDKVKKVFDVL
jgi:S-adenosylmethionine synthetase